MVFLYTHVFTSAITPISLCMVNIRVAWPQAADSTRAAVFTILFTHIYMFSLCILFPVLVFRGIEVGLSTCARLGGTAMCRALFLFLLLITMFVCCVLCACFVRVRVGCFVLFVCHLPLDASTSNNTMLLTSLSMPLIPICLRLPGGVGGTVCAGGRERRGDGLIAELRGRLLRPLLKGSQMQR